MRGTKVFVAGAFASAMFISVSAGPAGADPGTHKVFDQVVHDGYPSSPDPRDAGWYRQDTRTGGTVGLSNEFGAPAGFGNGSLKLTTDGTDAAKAQLITYDDVYGAPLVQVNSVDYYTYQSAPVDATGAVTPPAGEASYQLRIDLDGDLSTTADQTNLVYEPYWNDTQGPSPQQPIAPNGWQHWDATDGQWWSSQQIGDPNGAPSLECPTGFHIEPGGGGQPFTKPSDVALNCPLAKVVSIGVNVGSYNPNYTVAVDGVHLNLGMDSYLFNFEPGSK